MSGTYEHRGGTAAHDPAFDRDDGVSALEEQLLEALIEMHEAWEEQFGEGACDCMPEPENAGHVCPCCKARAAIAKATGSAA